MKFKLRVETRPDFEYEVVLRAPKDGADLQKIEKELAEFLSNRQGMALTRAGVEFFLPLDELLFFETDGSKTAAHTQKEMFYTEKRLRVLEEILPFNFIRVSKSCILNVSKIQSIAKNITGASAVCFFGSEKKAYVSRSCFKQLRERIDKIRLEPQK